MSNVVDTRVDISRLVKPGDIVYDMGLQTIRKFVVSYQPCDKGSVAVRHFDGASHKSFFIRDGNRMGRTPEEAVKAYKAHIKVVYERDVERADVILNQWHAANPEE